jgi:hypothetical protein
MRLVEERISVAELGELAAASFGNMVKAVVDVELEILVLGGEMHADEEALLLEQGSSQENLWGINIYPELGADQWIEFDSMINLRPSQGNRSRYVESESLRRTITAIVQKRIRP